MTAARVLCIACALLILIIAGPDSLASVTSLLLDGEPGEPIGGGEFHFYTPDDGWFNVPPWSPDSLEEARLTFSKPGFLIDGINTGSWQFWFAAPPGEPLVVGLYDDAVVPRFRGPGQPGIQVTGNGLGPCFGGTGSTGRFEVKQIAFDQYGVLTNFWATFEQSCGGLLRGELRFNAEVPVELHAPSHWTAQEGRALEFEVQGQDALGNPADLDATGLPAGASFTDAGNGSGRFAWLPEAGQAGPPGWLAFSGAATGGETDVVHTRIDLIPDFDDFDHPLPIASLPFTSTVYHPVVGAAADDPVCPPMVGDLPGPPAASDQGSAWYEFTAAEESGIQIIMRADSPIAAPPFFSFSNLSVHAGERGALEPVACGRRYVQRFAALPGVTYRIMANFTPSAQVRLDARALPPAPANDGFDDATHVGSLPFSDAVDTTGAMFQSEPPHCIPPPPPPGTGPGFSGSGSLVPPTNVWYAYAPAEDTRVTIDTSGSNYSAQITAFSGPREALVPLGCDPARFTFTALAGRMYHLMIAGSFGPYGNDLQVLFTGRPALRIQVAIGADGVLDRNTGSAMVGGIVRCSRPSEITLDGTLRQDRPRVQGAFHAVVACDGATPWRTAVTPDASRPRPGRFTAGAAEAFVHASGVSEDEPDEIAVDDARSRILFKAGPARRPSNR